MTLPLFLQNLQPNDLYITQYIKCQKVFTKLFLSIFITRCVTSKTVGHKSELNTERFRSHHIVML